LTFFSLQKKLVYAFNKNSSVHKIIPALIYLSKK